MKKFRGKALAALLSLALIASSLPVTLASASSKTVSGSMVNDPTNDEFYLVNGDSSKMSVSGFQDLIYDGTTDESTIETADHQTVTGDIASVSHVSGDRLVKWTDDNGDSLGSSDADGTLKLTLRSTSVSGDEVLAVLYKGTYTDNDDNDVTVKASEQITIHVLNNGEVMLGKEDSIATGDAPSLDDLASKTLAYEVTGDSTKTDSETLMAYRAEPSADALATWTTVNMQAKDSESTPVTDTIYTLKATSSYLTLTDSTTPGAVLVQVDPKASAASLTFTAEVVDANDSAVSAAELYNSDDVKAKAKLNKEIKVGSDTSYVNLGKYKGKTYLYTAGALKTDATPTATAGRVDVTGYEVNFDGAQTVTVNESASVSSITGTLTELDINEGNVSSVDLDAGTVKVDNAKTGDIATDDGNVEISSDATAGKITAKKDTENGDVEVSGGKTDDITASGTVTLDPTEDDVTVTVGNVTAADVAIDSADSKVTVNSLKSKADGTFSLTGDNVSIGAIDFDYRGTTLTTDGFQGTIPAPKNATADAALLQTTNEDDALTVNGNVDIETIDITDGSKVTFDGSVDVADLEGSGTMVIGAGKLYVSDEISGTTLRLSDATLASGDTAFTAATDCVDVSDVEPFGFTLTKTTGKTVDTFKIDTLEFAGLQINKSSSSIVLNDSETFTASAYPGGTSLPSGYTVVWELQDNDGIFELTTNDNGSATVSCVDYDSTFSDENKATLVAYLVDEDGYEDTDYAEADCALTAIETPVVTWTSDTTADFTLAPGASYQFKITSATAPVMTAGTAGVLDVTNVGVSGNDYFIKVTAAANAAGKQTGIYLNGTKLLVVTVAGTPSFTSDTTSAVKVAKGASYQYKITASAAPSFAIGTAGVFNYTLVSQSGNNYFYKITAVGASGAQTGVYVNGTKVNVATVA